MTGGRFLPQYRPLALAAKAEIVKDNWGPHQYSEAKLNGEKRAISVALMAAGLPSCANRALPAIPNVLGRFLTNG